MALRNDYKSLTVVVLIKIGAYKLFQENGYSVIPLKRKIVKKRTKKIRLLFFGIKLFCTFFFTLYISENPCPKMRIVRLRSGYT